MRAEGECAGKSPSGVEGCWERVSEKTRRPARDTLVALVEQSRRVTSKAPVGPPLPVATPVAPFPSVSCPAPPSDLPALIANFDQIPVGSQRATLGCRST